MLRGVSCCCCLNSKSMLPLIFFNYFNKALKRVWLGRPSEKAFRSSAESLSLVLLSRSHVILTWKLWWQCLPVVTWFASFDFNSRWVSQEELACDPWTEHHSLCWVDSVIVILWNSPLQLNILGELEWSYCCFACVCVCVSHWVVSDSLQPHGL